MSATTGASQDELRLVHRKFATGVTVVTTLSGGSPTGLAVNAFASVSLEPGLVAVCINKSSGSFSALFAASHIGINILAEHQAAVARTFATKGVDRFALHAWRSAPHGSPIFEDGAAWMECEIRERLDASTHVVFFAQVLAAAHSDAPPLIYCDGDFYAASSLVRAPASPAGSPA